MRRDMPKVIVERPRRGRGRLRNRQRDVDGEQTQAKVGAKRDARSRGGRKYLNENLSPLLRFLESQVGRPWDKVWSEICANLKTTKAVHKHVRDHVPDFVSAHATIQEGEIWIQGRWRRERLSESRIPLWVDPRTGILRRNEQRPSRAALKRARIATERAELEKRLRVISHAKQLHLLGDGTWWEVTLARIPRVMREEKTPRGVVRYELDAPVRDVVFAARLSNLSPWDLYADARVYAIAKRKLSKKELHEHGLR